MLRRDRRRPFPQSETLTLFDAASRAAFSCACADTPAAKAMHADYHTAVPEDIYA